MISFSYYNLVGNQPVAKTRGDLMEPDGVASKLTHDELRAMALGRFKKDYRHIVTLDERVRDHFGGRSLNWGEIEINEDGRRFKIKGRDRHSHELVADAIYEVVADEGKPPRLGYVADYRVYLEGESEPVAIEAIANAIGNIRANYNFGG